MSDKNENLAERTGTVVFDFEDRRRLACSRFMLDYETTHSNGITGVTPVQYGATVLAYTLDASEIVQMGDRMTAVLAKNLGIR
jgi:hypothetical protein